jgi:formylglycine-generating enzyme required for sulfatase activity
VDLSAGSDAKTYPVTYLDAAPAAGWGTPHKTDRLVLRRVEPGTFVMGSPESETGRRPDERRHSVTLTRAYYIGVFEVTQRQWELVMGENPSWFKSAGAVRPVEQVSYCMVRGTASGLNWPSDGAVDGDSFMGRLRARTGLTGFDLPTEAQWECSCRAATEGALNSGKDLTGCDRCPNVEEVAVYRRNRDEADAAASPERGGTAAAGCRQPNRWGLYDMHGNVLEWCRDRFGPYEGDTVSDPVGAASESTRVLRGGPWWYYDPQCAANCRSARRYDKNPRDGGKQFGWGLRAAMEEP